ncbi:MAG: putative bifunctional diguanylate cyclase/phosphodiesterase [Xanthobacteraceae bacterium]
MTDRDPGTSIGSEGISCMVGDTVAPDTGADAPPAPRRRALDRLTIYRPAWIAAAAGVLLSLIAAYAVARWEHRIAQVEFESAASAEATSMSHGIQDYIGRLETLRTLFESANEDITRSEFEVFSKRLFEDHRGVARIGWIPRVRGRERAEFEAAAMADGLPSFMFKAYDLQMTRGRAPDADEYLPIFYSTEPKTSVVYGMDYATDPARHAVLERARDGDAVTVLTLAARGLNLGAHNLLIVVPVYVKGTSRGTIADRRRNITGYVTGVFDMTAVLQSIMDTRAAASAIDVNLYPHASDMPGAIDTTPADFSTAETASPMAMKLTSPLRWTGELAIGDKHWTIAATLPAGGPLIVRFPRALIVLFIGLIITAFAFIYLNVSGRNAERLQLAHLRVLELAQTDTLTRLANRACFLGRLDDILCNARDSRFSVLMLDLDRFKNVNDSLGHAAGDLLLREVAERLKSGLRDNDLLARLGGDEFAIIQMAGDDQRADATALATRITQLMAAPFHLRRRKVDVGASIGIAMAPDHGRDPQDLLRRADLALYRSKAAGRSCFTFFDPAMAADLEAQNTLEGDLREAIAEGQFEVFYQPVYDIATERPCGAEALLRWRHPTAGLIPPDKFIPLAESTGLIVPLGEWVLGQACRDAAAWPDDLKVAVNLSPVQFKQKELFGVICAALLESGLAPQRLEIEITESVLLERGPDNLAFTEELKEIGVSLALDDFGTGYSSLSYLTMFPFDKIKIDKSFIRDLGSNAHCGAIVSSILTLARGLDISVTAEGVETAEQLALLRQLGTNFAQGYLLGKPMPVGDLDAHFRRAEARVAAA